MGICFSRKKDIPPVVNNDLLWLECPYECKSLPIYYPPISVAKVIKVYDGDTVTIASKIGEVVYKFQVRLNGIDTAELRGTTGNTQRMAQLAKEKLHNIIFNEPIELKNICYEKYGRILCDIYYHDLHINQWMLDHHLAIPYDGKTKENVKVWEQMYDQYWKDTENFNQV